MFSKNRSQTSVENMSGTQCVIMPTSDSVTCYYSWNNSRFGRKWTDWIDKQWEGSRKPSGVRRQSASCPQPKYTSSNKYGGESWLMRCANLTARPKTSLTSCDPLHFSREVSSWLCQSLTQSFLRQWSAPAFCLTSKLEPTGGITCVCSVGLCILAATFSDDLMDLSNLFRYPNLLNLINNTLIQRLHSWWDRVSRHFDGCLRGGLSCPYPLNRVCQCLLYQS